LKRSLKWSTDAIDLLNFLHSSLAKTLEAWDRFRDTGGPIGYFADPDPGSSASGGFSRLLASIRRIFDELREHETELLEMTRRCTNNAKAVGAWEISVVLTLELTRHQIARPLVGHGKKSSRSLQRRNGRLQCDGLAAKFSRIKASANKMTDSLPCRSHGCNVQYATVGYTVSAERVVICCHHPRGHGGCLRDAEDYFLHRDEVRRTEHRVNKKARDKHSGAPRNRDLGGMGRDASGDDVGMGGKAKCLSMGSSGRRARKSGQ